MVNFLVYIRTLLRMMINIHDNKPFSLKSGVEMSHHCCTVDGSWGNVNPPTERSLN